MPFTQAHRRYAVGSSLGEDRLLFRRMVAEEHLSRPFLIRLELYSEDAALAFDDVLGTNMTVRVAVAEGETRYFNGFVSQFSQVGTSGRLALYQATLRPWLWFLTRTADCRIFQQQKVPDIVKQVFRDHGFTDFEEALSASYREWDYCVQYRETDFNFVSRLLEQEGIYYFFKHEDGRHRLVLADSSSAHSVFPGYAEIPYFPPDEHGRRRRDHIHEWGMHREVQTGSYVLNDFDFEKPRANLKVPATVSRAHALSGLPMYDYPGEYTQRSDGESYARVRIEELQAEHARCSGAGDVRGIAPGFVFSLTDFPRADQNREYLVVGATQEASSDEYESRRQPGGAGESYLCTFTAMPSDTPFRAPRVTPKPVIQGPQTAIVVGPAGEEMWTDRYARVKVQFHWDRYGKADENSSCWVRVAQLWAGKGWGAIHIPRVGQEVVVDFLEGDPDRPLITGRVYNAESMPPYALPGEATKSAVKSMSSKGGGGFNELRFEDKKGSEQVFLHAERNYDQRVKSDRFEWIGHDRHRIVKNDEFTKVEKNVHRIVMEDLKERVDGDVNLSVGGDRRTKVGGGDHLTVSGDHNVKVGGDVNIHGAQSHNHKVGNTYSLTAGMDLQAKVGMNTALESGMAVHLKAGMTMVLEAGVQLSLKVGGNFIDINPGGIFIQGTMVMINSGGAAGSGAGASPTAPASPAAPDVPEEAKEAATARPGELPSTQAQPDQRQAQSPGSVRVGSQSQALREGAQEASPVCEECERAGQGQEPPDTTSGRPLSEVSEPQAETQAEPTGTSGGPTQGAPGGGGGGPPEEEEVQM